MKLRDLIKVMSIDQLIYFKCGAINQLTNSRSVWLREYYDYPVVKISPAFIHAHNDSESFIIIETIPKRSVKNESI